MSFISPTTSTQSGLSLDQIGAAAGVPNLNTAAIPQNVRDGNATARQAYTEGLAFEQVLVNQLTQQLSSTMDASSADSSSDSTDGSSMDGSDSSSSSPMSAFSSLIPQALTSSIMDGGGLGMADGFAEAIDPSMQR